MLPLVFFVSFRSVFLCFFCVFWEYPLRSCHWYVSSFHNREQRSKNGRTSVGVTDRITILMIAIFDESWWAQRLFQQDWSVGYMMTARRLVRSWRHHYEWLHYPTVDNGMRTYFSSISDSISEIMEKNERMHSFIQLTINGMKHYHARTVFCILCPWHQQEPQVRIAES